MLISIHYNNSLLNLDHVSPPTVYCQERVGLYLVGDGGMGDPYWNVRSACFVLGQGPRGGDGNKGSIVNFFLRVNILWQHPGSTVNPALGVNILSFTAEGESIYVQDMFCLLIGCGNASGQNTSDTTRFYTLQK